jgi:hypothetical protein
MEISRIYAVDRGFLLTATGEMRIVPLPPAKAAFLIFMPGMRSQRVHDRERENTHGGRHAPL